LYDAVITLSLEVAALRVAVGWWGAGVLTTVVLQPDLTAQLPVRRPLSCYTLPPGGIASCPDG
jgi:hypothetical protein